MEGTRKGLGAGWCAGSEEEAELEDFEGVGLEEANGVSPGEVL